MCSSTRPSPNGTSMLRLSKLALSRTSPTRVRSGVPAFHDEILMKPRVALPKVVLLLAGIMLGPQAVQAQVDSASSRDSTGPEDLLRPGDVIKLTVWREPDWSGEFPVNEAGVATLPRLGAISVTGLTADSLRRFVTNSLGVFLKNPSIEITPLRENSGPWCGAHTRSLPGSPNGDGGGCGCPRGRGHIGKGRQTRLFSGGMVATSM